MISFAMPTFVFNHTDKIPKLPVIYCRFGKLQPRVFHVVKYVDENMYQNSWCLFGLNLTLVVYNLNGIPT